jgi:hypothetical protein
MILGVKVGVFRVYTDFILHSIELVVLSAELGVHSVELGVYSVKLGIHSGFMLGYIYSGINVVWKGQGVVNLVCSHPAGRGLASARQKTWEEN